MNSFIPTYQRGSKFIGILDLGLAICGLFLYFFIVVLHKEFGDFPKDNQSEYLDLIPSNLSKSIQLYINSTHEAHEVLLNKTSPVPVQYSSTESPTFLRVVDISITASVVFTIDIWICVILLNGVKKKNGSDISLWFKVRLISLLVSVLFYMVYALQDKLIMVQEIYFLLTFLVRAFGLFIVSKFLRELREAQRRSVGSTNEIFTNWEDDRINLEYNKI